MSTSLLAIDSESKQPGRVHIREEGRRDALGDTMSSFRDVPAGDLIEGVKEQLESNDSVKAPEWAEIVKTGTHREMPPVQPDWWSRRAASILRKVALHGPIGTNHLAQMYGGARNRGVRPNRAVTGSRNVVRTILKQLDAAGYTVIKKNPAGTKELGRVVTPTGQSLLDQVSKEIRPSAVEAEPGLGKY